MEIFTGLSESNAEYQINQMNEVSRLNRLGSRVKNQGYNIKVVFEHTWAGGAANTDTATMPSGVTLAPTDIIVVSPLDSAAITSIKGVYASASTIDLTSVGNGADSEIIQVMVLHKVVEPS